MTFRVGFLEGARRALAALDKPVRVRMQAAIDALAETPRPNGAIAMQGTPAGRLRIRVGDYRIVYEVHDDEVLVLVLDVGHRREVYR